MTRYQFKLNVFKNICLELATLSHDEKMKVATVIITDDFREICAIGYNGNAKGLTNARDSLEVGKSGYVHSEENALIHLCKPFELRDSLIMICTHKPCPMCAKKIINGNIKKVMYVHDYNALGPETDEIFAQANVNCVQL